VVISTANGLKFADFKVRYHERRLEDASISVRHANRPLDLPADVDQVKAAVFGSLAGEAARQVQRTAR
jgi:threonine synthase